MMTNIPTRLDFSRQFTQDIQNNLIATFPAPQTKQSLLAAVKERAVLAENLNQRFGDKINQECFRNPDLRNNRSRLFEISEGLRQSFKPNIEQTKVHADAQDLNNYLKSKFFLKRPFLKAHIESEIRDASRAAGEIQYHINFTNAVENLGQDLEVNNIFSEVQSFISKFEGLSEKINSLMGKISNNMETGVNANLESIKNFSASTRELINEVDGLLNKTESHASLEQLIPRLNHFKNHLERMDKDFKAFDSILNSDPRVSMMLNSGLFKSIIKI